MITHISQNISFGKTLLGKYRIQKSLPNGKEVNVPVKIFRLDNDRDYGDRFNIKKIKHISLYNFFDGKTSKAKKHIDYIAETGLNKKLVGIATCRELENTITLQAIGTSNSSDYKGVGRALLAGIAQDLKGKYSELHVSTVLPSTHDFYTKCHFQKNDKTDFYLKESDFNDLIRDAEAQFD